MFQRCLSKSEHSSMARVRTCFLQGHSPALKPLFHGDSLDGLCDQKWPCSCCFVRCYFLWICSKQYAASLLYPSCFFYKCFVSPICNDTGTTYFLWICSKQYAASLSCPSCFFYKCFVSPISNYTGTNAVTAWKTSHFIRQTQQISIWSITC